MGYKQGADRQVMPPRDVPGYDRAVAAGLTPVVPDEPPEQVCGLPASRAFWVMIGAVLGSWVVFAVVLSHVSPSLWLVLSMIALVVGTWWRTMGQLERAVLTELRAGYATLELANGFFAWDRQWRFPKAGPGPSWDYRGVWLLDSDGNVRRAPDRTVLPPGHYPSPNRPGFLELWTGTDWAYRYRSVGDILAER